MQVFRDLLLIKQSDKRQKDYMLIEKIGKLLVSDIDTIKTHMTKVILLKIAKVFLSHSILVRKRITGNIVSLLISNEVLRKSVT
jgi:hypothetical protein